MKRTYKSGAQKRSDKKRKYNEFQQVLAKNKSMYDFINRPTTQQQKQHDQIQASEIQTSVDDAAESRKNSNLDTGHETTKVINSSKSVVVEASVSGKHTQSSNLEGNQAEIIQEKTVNEVDSQSSVSAFISTGASSSTDGMEETLTNPPACIAINCPSPPASLNSDQKRFILSKPPSQPPGPFPKDQKGRCFSDYHYHFLSASVRMQRKWLCYSSKDNFVYCRYYWLFGDVCDLIYQPSWVRGINDWQQLSRKIKKHESSPCHIKASFTAVEWMHDQTIDKSVEASKQKQINFWMEVVERLIKIYFIAGQK